MKVICPANGWFRVDETSYEPVGLLGSECFLEESLLKGFSIRTTSNCRTQTESGRLSDEMKSETTQPYAEREDYSGVTTLTERAVGIIAQSCRSSLGKSFSKEWGRSSRPEGRRRGDNPFQKLTQKPAPNLVGTARTAVSRHGRERITLQEAGRDALLIFGRCELNRDRRPVPPRRPGLKPRTEIFNSSRQNPSDSPKGADFIRALRSMTALHATLPSVCGLCSVVV